MADLRDYTKKNPVFVGTDGIRLPTGNNAQRTASSNVAGTMRYNSDLNGLEVYSPTGWTPLAAPPTISTVTPGTFTGQSGTEFTINGTGFTPDAQVSFVTSNGTSILAATVTYFSSAQLRATTPRNITVQEEPISVRVTQQSGSILKTDCIDAGGVPSWITTAGTLGSIFGANSVNVYVSATDPEGTTITYQLTSGSLPGGLSLSANGLVQGLANSVLANTTYNFVIKANDTVNNNTDRSFSYTILNRAPVINTAAGSLATIYSGNAIPTTTISAYDPDGGQLVYSVSSGSLPANTGLGSANGVIQGTPIVVTTNTNYTVGITVTDEGSLTASNTYTFTVLNRPPVWNTSAGSLGTFIYDSYSPVTVNAYDPDGAAITYSVSSGSIPAGLSFNTSSGAISGTPTEPATTTTSSFTVTATDVGSEAVARSFSLTITPFVDEFYANTVLLLQGDATSETNNATFIDSSASNWTITRTGDISQGRFTPFSAEPGKWSVYNSGSSSYCQLNNTNYSISTGDFTIEFWMFVTGDKTYSCFCSAPSNPNFTMSLADGSTNSRNLYLEYGGSGTSISGITNYLNTWTHIAVVRSSGTVTVYKDGTSIGSASKSAAVGDTANLYLLRNSGDANQDFPGYISNFRICKSAVYTSNFTPTTSPLTTTSQGATNCVLLTFQDNRFKDNSTANTGSSWGITKTGTASIQPFSPFAPNSDYTFASTGGSLYFPGGNYYLTPNNGLPLGAGDFTIDFWLYSLKQASSGTNLYTFFSGEYSGGGQGWALSVTTYAAIANYQGLTFGYGVWGSYTVGLTTGNYLSSGTWQHIAVTRTGSTWRFFVDGVSQSYTTQNQSATWNSTNNFNNSSIIKNIGPDVQGYIHGLRVVVGTSLYTANFTPPTSPPTAVSGSTILLSANNASIVDTNRRNIIQTFGNARTNTSVYKYGTSSLYFNSATSDYIQIPDSEFFNYTGDFTIEFWMNPISAAPATTGRIYSHQQASVGAFLIAQQSSTGFLRNTITNSAGTTLLQQDTTVAPSAGVWTHVAYVRFGNVFTFYINGVANISTTAAITISNMTNAVAIGANISSTPTSFYNGYLDDYRVTRAARYTANFTPPTRLFPNR
jgi:hypothetical protein